jgi:hypothetical protein
VANGGINAIRSRSSSGRRPVPPRPWAQRITITRCRRREFHGTDDLSQTVIYDALVFNACDNFASFPVQHDR